MKQNKFTNITENQMNNPSLLFFLSFENTSLVLPWIHWLNLEQDLLILYNIFAEIIARGHTT